MKLVKLSLVAALAAGAFSVANATPVEEAIKDIDVSGVLRYRYDTGSFGDRGHGFQDQRSSINSHQDHNYRAQLNFNAAIADNFKAFVQFDYSAKDGGYRNNVSDTSSTFTVRQMYLTYTNEDVATSVIAGKQQLNTIWTDNGVDGLVGTGIKVVNNSIDGLTLAAFAVDSFNTDNETDTLAGSKLFNSATKNALGAPQDGTLLNIDPYAGNLYGAAAIGSYDVMGGQFNPQLWLAYLNDTGFFYALDLAYATTIFDGVNWTIQGTYLGNSLDSKMKDRNTIVATDYVGGVPTAITGEDAMGNGNLFALKGTIEVNGWDASLGGIYYGKKDKLTFNTLEDKGNLDVAGEEIFYTDGSNLNGDVGRNIFGYITAGYTFNETVRVGADFVYGGTKTGDMGIGGKKLEAVARVDYKYSPKLDFSAFYSYVNVSNDNAGANQEDGRKNTVRLQALYKF